MNTELAVSEVPTNKNTQTKKVIESFSDYLTNDSEIREYCDYLIETSGRKKK